MYTNLQKLDSAEVADLRKAAGAWHKELREKRGLSQRQLAELVGVEYYTFVSQLETGRGRIPPDRYVVWAKALDVDLKTFVTELLRFYDPVTHGILFGSVPAGGKTARPRKV